MSRFSYMLRNTVGDLQYLLEATRVIFTMDRSYHHSFIHHWCWLAGSNVLLWCTRETARWYFLAQEPELVLVQEPEQVLAQEPEQVLAQEPEPVLVNLQPSKVYEMIEKCDILDIYTIFVELSLFVACENVVRWKDLVLRGRRLASSHVRCIPTRSNNNISREHGDLEEYIIMSCPGTRGFNTYNYI
jgi:hypothetical protein